MIERSNDWKAHNEVELLKIFYHYLTSPVVPWKTPLTRQSLAFLTWTATSAKRLCPGNICLKKFRGILPEVIRQLDKEQSNQKTQKEYMRNKVFTEDSKKLKHIPDTLEGHVKYSRCLSSMSSICILSVKTLGEIISLIREVRK